MHLLIQTHPDVFGCAWPHTSRKPERGEKDSAGPTIVKKEAMQRMLDEGSFAELTEDAAGMLGTTYAAIERVRSARPAVIRSTTWCSRSRYRITCESCIHHVHGLVAVQVSCRTCRGQETT